jgi:hypothetical protein
LILALDHVIADAVSLEILGAEILTLYRQAEQGLPFSLPKLVVQFADYVVWQQQTYSNWLKQHEVYWRQRLAGASRIRIVSNDGLPKAEQPVGALLHIPFGDVLSAKFREVARREQIQLALVVFCVFTAVMMHWCQRKDLVIKFLISGRHHAKLESMIGFGFDLDGGMINWDPTETDVGKAWTDAATVKKGLFWDDIIARYVETRQFANPPTRKAEDEAAIKKADEAAKTGKRPDVSLPEGRLLAFKALDEMGKALKGAGVARLSFTNCTSGAATRFMDRLAKLMGVEVACFKETTFVFNDGFEVDPKKPSQLRPNSLKGKSRMILERDKMPLGQNKGTNIPAARIFSPDLDNASIAFVGKP